jgi:hypothetical protein
VCTWEIRHPVLVQGSHFLTEILTSHYVGSQSNGMKFSMWMPSYPTWTGYRWGQTERLDHRKHTEAQSFLGARNYLWKNIELVACLMKTKVSTLTHGPGFYSWLTPEKLSVRPWEQACMYYTLHALCRVRHLQYPTGLGYFLFFVGFSLLILNINKFLFLTDNAAVRKNAIL